MKRSHNNIFFPNFFFFFFFFGHHRVAVGVYGWSVLLRSSSGLRRMRWPFSQSLGHNVCYCTRFTKLRWFWRETSLLLENDTECHFRAGLKIWKLIGGRSLSSVTVETVHTAPARRPFAFTSVRKAAVLLSSVSLLLCHHLDVCPFLACCVPAPGHPCSHLFFLFALVSWGFWGFHPWFSH